MLYDHIHEEDGCKTMSINDFRDDDDPLKEHSIFDEIPERLYTIECEGYADKNGKPLDDETTIKHLTDGEQVDINVELELCDENDDEIDYMDYEDYYYYMNLNKTDLCKITKQIRSKKFIYEVFR
ncbi:hypothetical protein M9Y10_022100 [Tritrichomonas musculus]|uniref:Uncharacterized protein n=1 Tax=Tritrichomonas musculus TaxID=1915356 RepID=A0ABR2KS71_9EUKA